MSGNSLTVMERFRVVWNGLAYEVIRSSPSELGDDRVFLAIERVIPKPHERSDAR